MPNIIDVIFIILMWRQMIRKKSYIEGILAWSGRVKDDFLGVVIWV